MTPTRDTTDRSVVPSVVRKNSNNSSSGYVYESDTVRRAYPTATPQADITPPAGLKMSSGPVTQTPPPQLQQQQSVRPKDIPYHAREDSKPFTYGMVGMAQPTNGHHHHHQENGNGGAGSNGTASAMMTSTPVASATVHGRNWKESSSNTINGQQATKRLESPSLVRKFSNGTEPVNISPVRSSPRIPVPSIADPVSPRPIRKLSESLLLSNGGGASTPTSSDAVSASNASIQPVATSSPRLDNSRNRSASTSEVMMKTMPTPQLQHHISLEETIQDISTSPDSSRYVRPLLSFLSFLPIFVKFRDADYSLRRKWFTLPNSRHSFLLNSQNDFNSSFVLDSRSLFLLLYIFFAWLRKWLGGTLDLKIDPSAFKRKKQNKNKQTRAHNFVFSKW